MYTCAHCAVCACKKNELDNMPKNCPMQDESILGVALPEEYQD